MIELGDSKTGTRRRFPSGGLETSEGAGARIELVEFVGIVDTVFHRIEKLVLSRPVRLSEVTAKKEDFAVVRPAAMIPSLERNVTVGIETREFPVDC